MPWHRALVKGVERAPESAAVASDRRPRADAHVIAPTGGLRMAIKEYEPGTAFPGVMGRTVGESSPAWPRPLRAKPGSPNVLYHRPRRHRLRAPRLLRLADPDAEPRPARRERPALQQHAHDRALLAQPLVHADRPQPPLERDGLHHRGRDRLSRARTASSRSRTASCPRCCCRTATTRSRSANGT